MSTYSFRTAATAQDTGLGGRLMTSTTIVDKHLSWDLRLVRSIKRLEAVIFSSSYAMIQANQIRIKMSLVGVLIDFLQVMAFTMSSDFGWSEEFNSLGATVALGHLHAMYWQTFAFAFSITVAVIVSALVVGQGSTFASGDYTRIWPIRYMRIVVNLMLGVLFIPVLTVLIMPLETDGNHPRYWPEVIAWGEKSTFYSVTAIVMLMIFIPLSLFIAILNFEFSSRSKDPMARHTSWFDFIYLILKTVVTLIANMAVDAVVVRVIVILVATAFVTCFVFLIVPYYSVRINILRASLFSGLLGASISVMIKVFAGSTYDVIGAAIGSAFMVHMMFTVVFAIAGGLFMWLRITKMLSKKNLFAYLKPGLPPRSSSSLNSGRGLLRTESLDVRPPPESPHRRLTRTFTAMEVSPGRSKHSTSIWNNIKGMFIVADVMGKIRFLRESGTKTEDLVGLADSVFQQALEEYPSHPQLLIHYANFVAHWREDWVTALAQLRKANTSKSLGIYNRWQSYTVAKYIERMKKSTRVGTLSSSVDLMKFIEFQHSLENARRFHYLSLYHLRLYWEALQFSDTSKVMFSINNAQKSLAHVKEKASFAYSHLITRFSNAPLLWRSYGSFLKDVCFEDAEAEDAFRTADDIEDQKIKQAAAIRARAASPTANTRVIESAVDDDEVASVHDTEDTQSQAMSNSRRSSTNYESLRGILAKKAAQAGTIKKLHVGLCGFLFVTTFGLGFMGIVAVSVQGNVLESFDMGNQVFQVHHESTWTALQLNGLVLQTYLNRTAPFGAQTIASIENKLTNITSTMSTIYGMSNWYGKDVWKTKKLSLLQWSTSDTPITPLSVYPYSAFTEFIRAAKRVVSAVKDGSIAHMSFSTGTGFPFVLMNSMSELGGTWDLLDSAHVECMSSRAWLFVWIMLACVGFVGLVASIAFSLVVLPGLKAFHMELHVSHALSLLIPLSDCQKIRAGLQQRENEMLQQIKETEDSDDELPDMNIDAQVHMSTDKDRKKKRKKLSDTASEAFVYNTALKHVSKCHEMRPLMFRWVLGIAFCNIVFIAALFYASITVVREENVSKQLAYASMGLSKVAIAATSSYYVPHTTQPLYSAWGGDSKQTLSTAMSKADLMHNNVVYGDLGKTYDWNQLNVPIHAKKYSDAMTNFTAVVSTIYNLNSTTATMDSAPFYALQSLVNDGGSHTKSLINAIINAAREKHILASNTVMIVVLALEVYLIVVMYYFVSKRSIMDGLRSRSAIAFSLLKMVPNSVFKNTPLLSSFIRDRKAFLTKVRESAIAEKATKDFKLDAEVIPSFIEGSEHAYLAIDQSHAVVFKNKAARSLFLMNGEDTDKWGTAIMHLVHPQHHLLMNEAITNAIKNPHKAYCESVIARRSDGSTFFAHVKVTAVEKTLIIKWTIPVSQNGGVDSLVNKAGPILWRNEAVVVVTPTGDVLGVNDKALSMLEQQPSQFVDMFHPSSQNGAAVLLTDALTDHTQTLSSRLMLSTSHPVRVTVLNHEQVISEDPYVLVTLESMRDMLAIEESIRRREAIEQTLMSTMSESILVVDQASTVVNVNDAALRLLCYENRSSILGQSMSTLLVSGSNGWAMITNSDEWMTESIKCQNGDKVVVSIYSTSIDGCDDRVVLVSSR